MSESGRGEAELQPAAFDKNFPGLVLCVTVDLSITWLRLFLFISCKHVSVSSSVYRNAVESITFNLGTVLGTGLMITGSRKILKK